MCTGRARPGRALNASSDGSLLRWCVRASAAGIVVACSIFITSCAGGENLSGSWEGEIVESGETLEVMMDIDQEGDDISGEITGDQGRLDITGGEVNGSQFSLDIQDAYGGDSVQGTLEGEISGDNMSGQGEYNSGTEFTFELQRTEN